MRAFIALGLVAASISLAPTVAAAGERAGDAALGALAGAVVAGPVGLVGGGVIGYTAGPGIANEWGLRHRHFSAAPQGSEESVTARSFWFRASARFTVPRPREKPEHGRSGWLHVTPDHEHLSALPQLGQKQTCLRPVCSSHFDP